MILCNSKHFELSIEADTAVVPVASDEEPLLALSESKWMVDEILKLRKRGTIARQTTHMNLKKAVWSNYKILIYMQNA